MRVREHIDVGDPDELREILREHGEAINGGLDRGDPGDPDGPRAGNVAGQWIVVTVESANAAVTFTHNLDLPEATVSTTQPNVTWEASFVHSGAGTGGMSLEYQTGDNVDENAIELRLRTGRTVAAGANAVRVAVRFEGASPW